MASAIQRMPKVQLHIPQVFSKSGKPTGIFAHNFVVIVDMGGHPVVEFDGLGTRGRRSMVWAACSRSTL